MSDIGLCYFAGKILSLMLIGVTNNSVFAVSWLLVLALCTFPYTVFSVWHQAFKIKKWCPLCLAVIVVLWAEIALAISIWSDLAFFPVTSAAVFALLTGFALPVFAWAYVKPLWKEHIRISGYEYRYKRLKRTPDFIHAMLAKEPVHDMEFSAEDIHLGAINAPVHITAIMSLYCQPCVKSWNVLIRLISEYSDSLRVTVRFFTGYGSLKSDKEIYDVLATIYLQMGQESFCKALTDWYESRDIQQWKSKYFAEATILSQSSFTKIARWEKELSINYTPAVFVDNRMLPQMFTIEDLEYLLKKL